MNTKKKMPLQDQNGLHTGDMVLFAIMAVGCFLLMGHTDIIVTGNHAMLMLQGHIGDFYSACHDFMNSYAANYMPSVFAVFALWNLPLRFFGGGPRHVEEISLLQIYWYKLLPCIFYLWSGVLVYRLCLQTKMEKHKARFTAYAFMTAPLAFFSQFLFCQYDIFPVFFMLCALKYYLKEEMTGKDYLYFSLLFGLAGTFKYHVFFYFLVLLLLRQKDIPKLIANALLALLPMGAETGFYLLSDAEAFRHSVLEFSAMGYVSGNGISVGGETVNLMALCACLLFAWSYFTQWKTEEELLAYLVFFANGISIALFGLMPWHPQWLLLGVFFWTLSTCICRYTDTFLWLDMLEIVMFYAWTVIRLAGTVDQNMLVNGIFRRYLADRDVKEAVRMMDVCRLGNADTGLIYTVFLVILIINFVFKHPRFCQKEMKNECGSVWLLRFRFLVGILLFVIPALCCLPDMKRQERLVYYQYKFLDVDYAKDFAHCRIVQGLPQGMESITGVKVFVGTFETEPAGVQLQMLLEETGTGQVLAEVTLEGKELRDNSYAFFPLQISGLDPQAAYQLEFRMLPGVNSQESVTLYYYREDSFTKNNETYLPLEVDGDVINSSLVMRITGNR